MERIKFTIKFRLEQRKDSAGQIIVANVPINANITFCGKRGVYFTGHRIDAGKWSDDKQEVKRSAVNKAGKAASEINADLRRIQTAVENVFARLAAMDRKPTPEVVRTELRTELGDTPTSRKTVIEYLEQYMDEAGRNRHWTESNRKKYGTFKAHLKEFAPRNFYFEDITKKFLSDFVDFLIGLGLRNSTTRKTIGYFTYFLNWASEEGYNTNMEYSKFRVKLTTTLNKSNVFALSVEEFIHLYEMPIDNEKLERVRDVFCFCCSTSLRYSDVRALKWSDIKDKYIEITTQKTHETLRIPLIRYAVEILHKYEPNKGVTEHALPVISNQKYNDYLKELGKLAGFDETQTKVYYIGGVRKEETKHMWEVLTSHVARKTFVTLGLACGIPAEVVRSITGHKTAAVMDRYVKFNMDEIATQMKKMNGMEQPEVTETIFNFHPSVEELHELNVSGDVETYLNTIGHSQERAKRDIVALYIIRKDFEHAAIYMNQLRTM